MPKREAPLFKNSTLETTQRIVRFTATSTSFALAMAPRIGVARLGRQYAWTRKDYVTYLSVIDRADERRGLGSGTPSRDDDGEE